MVHGSSVPARVAQHASRRRISQEDPVSVPEREPLRLMAVHAHPDDESSKGAATTARYAAEGVEVLVVTCTGGERGDILNSSFVVPDGHEFDTIEGRRAVRELEMAGAAEALGVRHRWLGFVDSGLDRKSTRLNSSHVKISYAVFCLK